MLGVQHPYTAFGVLRPVPASYDSDYAGHIVMRATYLPDTFRCIRTTAGRFPNGQEMARSSIQCFADVRANSYILGTGPPTLTLIVEEWGYGLSRLEEKFEGREAVLFIGPAIDHSIEVWQVFDTWGVSQFDDGTVTILHPYGFAWPEPEHQDKVVRTLPAFTKAVQEAHAIRMAKHGGRIGLGEFNPMVVLDANMLHRYHVDTRNTKHASGPPKPPPPVPQR